MYIVMDDMDMTFNDHVKQSQDWARHLKVVFARPLGDISHASFMAKKYHKSHEDDALINVALKENFVFSIWSMAVEV